MVAVLAPQESSLLGLVSVVAPVVVTGNTAVVRVVVRPPAAGGDVLRGAGHLRRARRRGQHPHRVGARRSRRGWPPTWTSTPSTWSASPASPTSRGDLEVAAADNLKRVRRAPAAEPDWSAAPDLDDDDRLPGDQDRLAPDRGLTGSAPTLFLPRRSSSKPAQPRRKPLLSLGFDASPARAHGGTCHSTRPPPLASPHCAGPTAPASGPATTPPAARTASGALTVTVDPTNRITEVAVHGRADHLRTPELLARAVDEAAGAARAARLRAGRAGSDQTDTTRAKRPVARPLALGLQAVENFQKTGTTPSGRLRGTSASTSTATSTEARTASPTTDA